MEDGFMFSCRTIFLSTGSVMLCKYSYIFSGDIFFTAKASIIPLCFDIQTLHCDIINCFSSFLFHRLIFKMEWLVLCLLPLSLNLRVSPLAQYTYAFQII